MEDNMLYKDDKIEIRIIIVGGKKELCIDYFSAGLSLGRMITTDLYDMNLVEINLAE
jgi:hypothetical protein